MKSMADGLPPEIAAQIHPDWRKNEAEYWANRDAIRAQYEGLWVAYAGGQVIASGTRSVEVLHAANVSVTHPFFVRLGAEHDGPRIRRATFADDSTYRPEPLPIASVEFRSQSGMPGVVLSRVIPDTGADVSAISWPDSQAIGFDPFSGIPTTIFGIGGQSTQSLCFEGWVYVDGVEHDCQVQVDVGGTDRILGRDVLNKMDVLFRELSGEVIFNP